MASSEPWVWRSTWKPTASTMPARAQASRIGRICSARFHSRPSSRRSRGSSGRRPATRRSTKTLASSVRVTWRTLPPLAMRTLNVPTSVLWSATLEAAEFAVAAAGEQGEVDKIAEAATTGIAQPRHLVVAEIAEEGSRHRPDRLAPPPGIVARHQAVAPGEVERSFEISEHAIGAGAPTAHVLGILGIEGGEVCFCALARAPVTRPLGEAAMPVAQALRGQFGDRQLAERRQNVALHHAFDALDRLAAAAAVIFKVIGDRARDGVRPVAHRVVAGGRAL